MRVKMNIIPSKFMFLAYQFHVIQVNEINWLTEVESVILVGVTQTEKEVSKNNEVINQPSYAQTKHQNRSKTELLLITTVCLYNYIFVYKAYKILLNIYQMRCRKFNIDTKLAQIYQILCYKFNIDTKLAQIYQILCYKFNIDTKLAKDKSNVLS